MIAALSSLKAPGKGVPTTAPAERVADNHLAVALYQAVDAASRQVGVVLTVGAGRL